jgi:hypothetical protein
LRSHLFFPAVAVVAALGSAGCRDAAHGELHGRVTLNGKPVPGGVIKFVPVDKSTPTASCFIENGEYTARVPVTTHRVFISSPQTVGTAKPVANAMLEDGPEVVESVPARYNTKSDLTVEVKPGRTEHHFVLEK